MLQFQGACCCFLLQCTDDILAMKIFRDVVDRNRVQCRQTRTGGDGYCLRQAPMPELNLLKPNRVFKCTLSVTF